VLIHTMRLSRRMSDVEALQKRVMARREVCFCGQQNVAIPEATVRRSVSRRAGKRRQ
jgi:hypothetical protein